MHHLRIHPFDDPSSTGTDDAPSYGEETAETLNAPKPETNVGGEVTQEPNNIPLSEQFYDKSSPMPDYDVYSELSIQGVPEDEIDLEVQRIIHNEPPEGQPHPYFGLDNREKMDTVVEPVIVFTGEYSHTIIDVQIPSRGFPLQFTRMYLSGQVYFGPFGYNWDHNYNRYLRELSDGSVAVWTGRLSEDVYRRAPNGDFDSPLGIFRKLEHEMSPPLQDRYSILDLDGMKQIFERPEGWPFPDRIPLVRIEDGKDNTHYLTYDTEGRLDRVEDHVGRRIKFIYGDCGLLDQVMDHTGRTWHYLYDQNIEHLISVTGPATLEYPNGVTTLYEYDRFREHPALLHNLIKVIDPNGEAVVENFYGSEPNTEDFGRVVQQEFGGFEARFSATTLQYCTAHLRGS